MLTTAEMITMITMITSSVDKIILFGARFIFVMAGMTFEVVVMAPLVVKINCVVTEITF